MSYSYDALVCADDSQFFTDSSLPLWLTVALRCLPPPLVRRLPVLRGHQRRLSRKIQILIFETAATVPEIGTRNRDGGVLCEPLRIQGDARR